MIICSCNGLSDHQVREAARQASARAPTEFHRCFGCSAKCGRCMRTIRKIMDETLGGGASGYGGCHASGSDSEAIDEFSSGATPTEKIG